MSINRRELLKMAALSPLLSVRAFRCQTLIGTQGAKKAPFKKAANSSANVLLHGLFFMEFQDNDLIVAAPFYDPHRYFYRDHQNPKSLVCVNADLGDFTDGPGSPLPDVDPFPSEILHFSKSDLGLQPGSNYIDVNKTYGCLLKLPAPKHIVALRCGDYDDFASISINGNVRSSIDKRCGPRLALITWLYYDSPSSKMNFKTRSYYAEHCNQVLDPVEVNNTLQAATNVFPTFDLRVSDLSHKQVDPDPVTQLPSYIAQDDESDLLEISGQPCPCPHKTVGDGNHLDPIRKPQGGKKVGKISTNRAVEVATCPQFGVIG